jgi:diacylglycerol kinase family enzyme
VFLALLGRLREARNFEVLVTKQISIETRGHLASISTDGEVIQINTPLKYVCRPGALRVIVPLKNMPEDSA